MWTNPRKANRAGAEVAPGGAHGPRPHGPRPHGPRPHQTKASKTSTPTIVHSQRVQHADRATSLTNTQASVHTVETTHTHTAGIGHIKVLLDRSAHNGFTRSGQRIWTEYMLSCYGYKVETPLLFLLALLLKVLLIRR